MSKPLNAPRLNHFLDEAIRLLEADGDDVTSHGPGVAADVGGSASVDAEAGEGGAVNPSDASDALDFYLNNMADLLGLEYGKTKSEAMSFVFSAVSQLVRDGMVPEIPGDNAAPQDIAIWLGKAKSVGLGAFVLGKARELR